MKNLIKSTEGLTETFNLIFEKYLTIQIIMGEPLEIIIVYLLNTWGPDYVPEPSHITENCTSEVVSLDDLKNKEEKTMENCNFRGF